MATQSATLHGSHARHGSANSATMGYPPLPASPTLTNPDMILPDYPDYDRADSPEDRSHSPLSMWKGTHASELDFHLPRQNVFTAAPLAPTTPIIYGNGTMLSDIGEVTEAESTVGPGSRRTSSRYSVQTDQGTGLQPAAMITPGVVQKSHITMRDRRSSVDSTSTITTQDQKGHFGDFDEAASVDDSVFQGDDEESMASSYIDDTYVHTQRAATKQIAQDRDKVSANLIGKRAEHILANAKRRLTTMEGNLSRARTSLSYSSMSDGSTPSPPMVRPATSLRESTLAMSPSHSRNGSDNSIHGPSKLALHSQRSASALGAAGGYRQPGSSSKIGDALNGGSGYATHTISHHPLDTTLQPLSEDGDDHGSYSESRRSSIQTSGLTSPTFEGSLSRSSSVAQMRDIQDQMTGLKGKISSLKEQARADSMKRRSLQSLRTPSPFTHARWDHGFTESRNMKTPDITEETPPNADVAGVDASEQELPAEQIGIALEPDAKSVVAASDNAGEYVSPPDTPRTFDETRSEENGQSEVDPGDVDDLRTENGDIAHGYEGEQDEQLDEAGEVDYASDSEGSTYHESFQNPVSHEDREDAFDYEHFFLHSAMGTLSRHRSGRRGSSGSISSDDSVETTRGPMPTASRRASLDTMSSVESFATATEGIRSRASTSHGRKTREEERQDYGEPEELSAEERNSFGFGNDHIGNRPRQNSVLHRPVDSVTASNLHRPSISSFDSTGTNRSFPLVNKARLNGGVLTPGGSPDHDLKQISESLMNDTASFCNSEGGAQSAAIHALPKDDQALVGGLVASLGKCVLGLGEASHASAAYRQRIQAARRILEGADEDS